MEITPVTFLIVCPFLFLAGLVDSIAGGGGLISIPAYLFAGLPPHAAIATNKMSSTMGTSISVLRYLKNKMVHIKLAIPSIGAAIIGASIGARFSLIISEQIMVYILYAILPVTAIIVLNKKLFAPSNEEREYTKKTYFIVILSSFFIGTYDGFYGPGTGTFLILAYTVFAKMNIKVASANTKVVNLTSNVTSLVIFLLHGQVLLPVGIAAGAANILGNFIGTGLVLNNGSKIVRPVILCVLVLLGVKATGII